MGRSPTNRPPSRPDSHPFATCRITSLGTLVPCSPNEPRARPRRARGERFAPIRLVNRNGRRVTSMTRGDSNWNYPSRSGVLDCRPRVTRSCSMRTLPIAVVAGMLTISSPGFSQDQGLVGGKVGPGLESSSPAQPGSSPLRRPSASAAGTPWLLGYRGARPGRLTKHARHAALGRDGYRLRQRSPCPSRSKHGSHHAGPKLAIDRQWSAH